jgi:TRAP-type uncharacterized transport system substrate-binding protein
MIDFLRAALAGALAVAFCLGAAAAAEGPAAPVVGLLAGGAGSTDTRAAADIAAVVDGDPVRVMPLLRGGSAEALGDLLARPGVDLAILQADALAAARRDAAPDDLAGRLQYVAKLYNKELHVIARADIGRIEELAGKRVGFGPRGGGAAVTGAAVFDALNIDAERVWLDDEAGLERLRRGELAAILYVAGRPAPLLRGLGAEDRLHLLAVPLTAELLRRYAPARLTHGDYPPLLPPGEGIDTVAVGAVLAVPPPAPGSEREHRLGLFVEAFFDRFAALLEPPRHPKWREVNLAAELPGWARFAPAEEWLHRHQADERRRAFEAFLDEEARKSGGTAPAAPEREALFERFLRWQQARQR